MLNSKLFHFLCLSRKTVELSAESDTIYAIYAVFWSADLCQGQSNVINHLTVRTKVKINYKTQLIRLSGTVQIAFPVGNEWNGVRSIAEWGHHILCGWVKGGMLSTSQ